MSDVSFLICNPLQDKSINRAVLQLCYDESYKVSKKLADLILKLLQCNRHQNLDLNRIFNFIDSTLLAKMQFSKVCVPKSTLRMIGNAASEVETKQTTLCNCLRRMTVRFLKCHANIKAWVLVNDLTKIVWAKSDTLEETNHLRLLQKVIAAKKIAVKAHSPLRLNTGNFIYSYVLRHVPHTSWRWSDIFKEDQPTNQLTLFVLTCN